MTAKKVTKAAPKPRRSRAAILAEGEPPEAPPVEAESAPPTGEQPLLSHAEAVALASAAIGDVTEAEQRAAWRANPSARPTAGWDEFPEDDPQRLVGMPRLLDPYAERISALTEALEPSIRLLPPSVRLSREILAALAAPFPAQDVSMKIQSYTQDKAKGMVVFFLDARNIMQRLDDTVAGDWSDNYKASGLTGGGLQCDLTVCGVTRSDVGSTDNDNETEKSAYSDALKRAAVKFGIGRYLYDVPKQWVALEGDERHKKIPASTEQDLRRKLENITNNLFAKVRNTQPTPESFIATQAKARVAQAMSSVGAGKPPTPATTPQSAAKRAELESFFESEKIMQGQEPTDAQVQQGARLLATEHVDPASGEIISSTKSTPGPTVPHPDASKPAPNVPAASTALSGGGPIKNTTNRLARFAVQKDIEGYRKWVLRLITVHPEYSAQIDHKPSKVPDGAHIRAAALVCGFEEINDETYKAVMEAISKRAEQKKKAGQSIDSTETDMRANQAGAAARNTKPAAPVARQQTVGGESPDDRMGRLGF